MSEGAPSEARVWGGSFPLNFIWEGQILNALRTQCASHSMRFALNALRTQCASHSNSLREGQILWLTLPPTFNVFFLFFFFSKIPLISPTRGDSVGSAALAKRLASLWKQQFPNIPIYIWGTGEGRRVALKGRLAK